MGRKKNKNNNKQCESYKPFRRFRNGLIRKPAKTIVRLDFVVRRPNKKKTVKNNRAPDFVVRRPNKKIDKNNRAPDYVVRRPNNKE